jgi:hypothetical protein
MISKFVISWWRKNRDSGFAQLAPIPLVSVSSSDGMNRLILRTSPVFASAKKFEKGR